MHILEIPSFFTPFGGEFCLDQAKALSRQGNEVRILSNVQLATTKRQADYFRLPFRRRMTEREGIAVYQSYQRGVPKAVRWNAERWVSIVRSMFSDYLGRYGRPDVLHAHCGKWAGYAAMLIGRDYGIPFVVTEHLPKELLATELKESLSDCWQLPLLRETYEQAAMVVTVSDELVADLACYFGATYPHQTIPNMIDVDFFSYRDRLSRTRRPFVFCCPAVFVERKGYDVLLRAFRKVVSSGADVRLLVAGQGTDSRAFSRLVAVSGCQGRVTCLGQLDRFGVRDMLYESDALVLATRGESQGLVLLEAMATGIPAISTEAIPRSARPDCGYRYVPVDDADALSREMLLAVGHPQPEGRCLSEQARGMASPEVIGQRIYDVLSAAVG